MPSTLTLTIEATDNGSSPRKGTITFTVNIKDREYLERIELYSGYFRRG